MLISLELKVDGFFICCRHFIAEARVRKSSQKMSKHLNHHQRRNVFTAKPPETYYLTLLTYFFLIDSQPSVCLSVVRNDRSNRARPVTIELPNVLILEGDRHANRDEDSEAEEKGDALF